jgi:hypothetical protein
MSPTLRIPPRVAPLALAALVVAWWASAWAREGSQLPLDLFLYFFPTYHNVYGRIAAGELPLWNPYQLCGIPWIGTLQAGVFYPAHAVYLVLSPFVGLAVLHVAHLVLVALTMAALARRLGLGAAGATVAAAVFTLRGRIPFAMVSPVYLEAAAWFPLGALGVVDVVQGRSRRGVCLLALATGMSLLAGYPQTTVYAAYTWAALWLALLVEERPGWRAGGAAALAFAAAIVLGALVAGVQLAPGLEHALVGTRATRGLDMATMWAWLTPAWPQLAYQAISGSAFAYGVVALGVLPAALAHPRRRVTAAGVLLLAGLAGVVSLGAGWSLFRLFLMLPAVGWFRNPDRLLVVTDFSLALAAAVGVDAMAGVVADAGRRRVAPALALVGTAAVVAAAWRGFAPASEMPTVLAFAAAVLVVVLAAAARGARVPAAGLLAVLAVAEIVHHPWLDYRLPYAADWHTVYEPWEEQLRGLAWMAQHDRAWIYGTGLQPPIALKLAATYGFRTISDYEPLNLRRQGEYFTYFATEATTPSQPGDIYMGDVRSLTPPVGTEYPEARRRLLDLAAVRFFAVPGSMIGKPEVARFTTAGGFVRQRLPRFGLWENPHALPRAFVTYAARPAPSDPAALLEAISDEDFDPLVESYVEGDAGLAPATSDTPRGAAASIVRDDPETVEIDAALDRPGLVVLADSFYPGWRAVEDGVPVPVLAVNHLFRGVPAPAGVHHVRFEYRPASVLVGAAATLAGLVATALLAVGGRRRRP